MDTMCQTLANCDLEFESQGCNTPHTYAFSSLSTLFCIREFPKKKLSLPEGRPTQCGSQRHTKQPYVGRFFVSHQDRVIFGSKVQNFHYFCIIFSFIVILMKNFEIYIINKYYRKELRNFFRNFPFIFSSRKRCFCWKNGISTFFNLGNQRLGICQGTKFVGK